MTGAGGPTLEAPQPPAISWNFGWLPASEAVALGLLAFLGRRGGWRDVWKFLAGSFFVSAGILYYFAVAGVSVPIIGTGYVESPRVSGLRAVAHSAFFATCLYLGFLRGEPHRGETER